jgi:16S rRNA (guanine966-N2)-methyltransferase
MADKIKEALFGSLASFGVQPERILDLYAGSGAIGIEALSRGGEWCDFVDRDKIAVQTIHDNLKSTGFEARAEVHHRAILDPPYADPAILDTLDRLSRSGAVQDGTIVVIGHWPRLEMPDEIGLLSKLRGRCHGDSCFAIFDTMIPEDGGVVD